MVLFKSSSSYIYCSFSCSYINIVTAYPREVYCELSPTKFYSAGRRGWAVNSNGREEGATSIHGVEELIIRDKRLAETMFIMG